MKTSEGIVLIARERQRQINEEGWTPQHDDEHEEGELSRAASCYIRTYDGTFVQKNWPWRWKWWKPTNRKRDLVKAGALIAAELDRMIRAEASDD